MRNAAVLDAPEPAELGSVTPRLWTPPLRELTPRTSIGFQQNRFAKEILRSPFDPWQEWTNIHAGELLPDGSPRFRTVLVLVARQNGKTAIPERNTIFWQFAQKKPLILGTSTKLDYAREAWLKSVKLVEKTPELKDLHPKKWRRDTNGEQESWTIHDARHKIAASNEEGGRSLTIHVLILDELRQHHSYDAWSASVPATNAVADAQVWCLSNAGDSRSIVLNNLRSEALHFIKTGEGDSSLGLFEWSCEENDDPTDLHNLAKANPNMGRRIPAKVLLGQAKTAVRLGGEALAKFQTEMMCISVKHLSPAVDPSAWSRCSDPGGLDAVRDRVALCLDVAPDAGHCTVYAAAQLDDGRVRVDFVEAWDGPGCTDAARRALPSLLDRVRPRVLGWLPSGPAAALAADLKDRGAPGWPPPGVVIEEIRGEVPSICMGLAELVSAGKLAHSNDPLLDSQISAATPLQRGDVWVFSRRGSGHVDACYAVAGAVHLARTLPPAEKPLPRPRIY